MPRTRVAPSCLAVLSEANRLYPSRSKASDGTVGDAAHRNRKSDHNPTADGWVHAVDVTNDPAHGCDAHRWARDVVRRKDPRVAYLISDGQICASYSVGGQRPWTWRTYTGSNPHKKHAHLSIKHTDQARNDLSPWFSEPLVDAPRYGLVVPVDMDDLVTELVAIAHLDDDGQGWTLVNCPIGKIVSLTPHGPNPRVDGYWNTAELAMQEYGNQTLVSMTDAASRGGGSFWVKRVA